MKRFSEKLKTASVFFVAAALILAVLQSCDRDDPVNEYREINDWILKNMEDYYLWNTQIPGRTNKALYPEEYFKSLLYSGDRFSWIQDNYTELMESLSGVNTEAGYDYNLLRLSRNSEEIMGYITYIKPGTPAEAANLKRGDYFLTINDTQLTTENYRSLIAQTASPHTLGKAVLSGNTIMSTTNISLSVIEYKENPILLDTVYHIQNKKIGYFVYNFFARDSERYGIAYEKELNDLFGKFKNEGIDELIIDLRYNSGGAVLTALALASMISNRSAADIFGYEEYNATLDAYYSRIYDPDYNKDFFLDFIKRYDGNGRVAEQIPVNKLSGLSRLHLIVTRRTASASELLINGLKPYMGEANVILIGDTTTGKNVGSFTIYETDTEKQKKNKWGMQPIVLKLSNVNKFSDYADGFIPNVLIREDNNLEIKPLGDTGELMLAAAINKILGITTASIRRNSLTGTSRIIGSSIDRTPARKNMYIHPNTHPNRRLIE